MPNDLSLRRPSAGARWAGPLFLAALGALALAGCGEEGIRQYTAPKAEAPEKVGLIGVIYPHGDLTWFFKLMGPESAVAAQADAVNDFMKSVHFTDQGDRPMEWKLPEGWQPVADAKAAPGRYATLRIESKDKPSLDLHIDKFPGAVGGLLANVNRWRGQVGLSPIEDDELDKDTRKEDFNGNPVTVVRLIGPGGKTGGSGAPFMNLPGAAAPDKAAFHYTKPDGWEEVADAGGPIVRAAVFKAKEGDLSAEITVTPLPGEAGGLLQNINRWRGQVQLEPITKEQLGGFPTVVVAGERAGVLDTGEGANGQRIVGAVVPHAGGTWFFKMTGPSAVVEKQKARFIDFLKSVKFGGDQ